MKDKKLKQILKSADAVNETNIGVPDMSVKIKNLAGAALAAHNTPQNEKEKPPVRVAKTAVFTKKRTRLIAASLAGILIIGVIAGGLVLLLSSGADNPAALNYNFELGNTASNRIKNAQFLPNIEKLVFDSASDTISPPALSAASELQPQSSTEINVTALDLEDFLEINRALAYVDGAHMYTPQMYDVYEIKSEVEFVLKAAPIFDKWFKMPLMDREHGHISDFPYWNWTYYLESDEKANEIAVTRLGFRELSFNEMDSYDIESSPRFPVMEWQLLHTKLYFDKDGREVIECFVYTLITDFKERKQRDFASVWNPLDAIDEVYFVPVSIEYLKNVKDSSLLKYYIRFEEFYVGQDGRIMGTDLRGLSPYGSTFDFISLDYADENDITLLRLYGQMPVEDIRNKPPATAFAYYNKAGNSVQFYASVHDYYDEQNSVVEGGYPLPGRSGSQVNILKLFTTEWPLLTDPQLYYNSNNQVYGTSLYDGLVSSEEITRFVEHYYSGTGSKDHLMENVYTALGGLAQKAGADGKITDHGQLDGLIYKMRVAAIKNFDMDKWLEFGISSLAAPVASSARGDFYGMDIPFGHVFTYGMESPSQDGKSFRIYGYAAIVSKEILENPDDYNLALALVSKDGTYVLLPSDRAMLSSRYTLSKTEPTFEIKTRLYVDDFDIKESGVYSLQYVLTQKINNEDVIVFDPKVTVNFMSRDAFLNLAKPENFRLALEGRVLKVIIP